jgi:urease accessory protein
MTLDQEAHVLISAPSANRVYRSLGEVSVQEVQVTVGPGAVLEWVPEPTIPFAGSRYRQKLHVTLASGATTFLWDAIAAGRIARKERWAFTSLENEIRITTASGGAALERYALYPGTDLGRVGLAEEWDYVASLFVINDTVTTEFWSRLETKLASILVAHAGPVLSRVLEGLWAAVRADLWSLPPVVWRKY